jgi:ketosteroid isomerase-like protein
MEGGEMRSLLIAGVLGFTILSLTACDRSNEDPALMETLQQNSDRYEIDQIEKTFHKATTMKDIDLMMTLWAPSATLTVGPGATVAGLEDIRQTWLAESSAFQPSTHLVSDHPAYKVEITVSGDRGTLHFECHYVDYKTSEVVLTTVADLDVARIDGRWLITNMVAASTELFP